MQKLAHSSQTLQLSRYIMRSLSLKVFSISLVCLFLSTCLFGQAGSAILSGRITDPDGLVTVGAQVEARNLDTGIVTRVTTNDSGIYNFANLAPGKYKIVITKAGFEGSARSVDLHVADNIALNLALKVGSAAETVDVSGSAPAVNVTGSALGGLVDERQIAELPLNGRNYINLTLLQPGITSVPNINRAGANAGTWYSSNGAPLRSNNYTLDGAILQDINSGSTASLSGTTLGLDGIQEYRVITNSFSAEYGMSMGSQTVIVSKGGTNGFHGSVFEYLRNSALDAANYFDRPVSTNNFQRLAPFRRNNFGGSFGGPIRKDKTFFFATYETLHERLGITNITNVPGAGCHGAAGAVITNVACPQLGAVASVTVNSAVAPLLALFPNPNLANNQLTFPYSQPDTDNYGQIRVDHVISPKQTMFARYTIDDDEQNLALPFPQFTNPRDTRHQYITASDSYSVSNSVMNVFRASFSRTATNRVSPTDLTGPQYSFMPGQVLGQIIVGGLTTFGPSKAAPSVQTQNILTFADDISYSRGKHAFKFGTLINSYRQYGLNSSGLTGQANFANMAGFLRGIPTSFSATTPGSNVSRTYHYYTLGFYAQDDWRILPHVSINAGLRYEPTTQVEEVHGMSSALINPASDPLYTLGPIFKNPSVHNFSPRLGFAWDVFGTGKTAVRGGAAILYDVANMGTGILTLNSGQPPFSSTSTVSGAALSLVLPLSFPASAVGKSGNMTYDYNLKQPHLISGNLTVEQQLPFATVLTVSYAGSRGIHLNSIQEGNPKAATIQPDGSYFWASNAATLNPNWGSVTVLGSNSDSIYHALQVGLIKHATKGLQFQSSYTWARAIDNTQAVATGDNITSAVYKANPFDSRYDRGTSSLDMPHNWVFNAIYSLPTPKRSEGTFWHGLASGWAISGLSSVHSGSPFSPQITTQRSRSGVAGGAAGNSGGIDRPNWNPVFTGSVIQGGPTQFYNPNAFILQPSGTLGNVARNALRGPGFASVDLSLRKDTKLSFLGETGNLQIRTDAFNLFNHPNFSTPDNRVFAGVLANISEAPLASAGQISSTVSPARQIQLSLRVAW
jgi:hypothetical protein